MISKEEIMSVNTIDEIVELESKKLEEYRNKIYNNLLKDKDVEKHIAKIFNVEINLLENVLMINGNPSLDDFEEEIWLYKWKLHKDDLI